MSALYIPSFDFVGRCRTCGFAAKHQRLFMYRVPGQTWFPLEPDERGEGSWAQGAVFTYLYDWNKGGQGGLLTTALECFVGAAAYSETGDLSNARHILNEDRKCHAWFPYRPGLTPYEHLDEKRMCDLERRREEVTRDMAKIAERIQAAGVGAQTNQWKVSLAVGVATVIAVIVVALLFH